MTTSPKISVILTAWNRPQYLEEQVRSIFSQTIPPLEIVLWYNQPSKRLGLLKRKQLIDFNHSDKVKKIICDHNFGIVPRFSLAPCLDGDYICIFDDDTIPGSKWFENCLGHIKNEDCILGTIGLRFLGFENRTVLSEKPRMGWEGNNEKLEWVDVVGHCWFFRKKWAKFFWDEAPLLKSFGEDIHFCAMLKKHGIRAACPPHPPDAKPLWGSLRPEIGVDKVAISCSRERSLDYYNVVKYEMDNGFKPMLLSSPHPMPNHPN
ncbi:MAG: glycosyltransferase [Deltaproteobacteria bacterium]|nr:glycosyltransferase [Deltaproteobacteria bacterium]